MAEQSPQNEPTTTYSEAPVDEPAAPSIEQTLGSLAAYMAAFAELSQDELRYHRPQPAPKELKDYPHASKWGWAALNGLPFDQESGLWPSSRTEWRYAEKMYDTNNHLGNLTATLAVAQQGIHQIGPDGKSAWRKDDSLTHLSRSDRKSVKKSEKNYQKAAAKLQHALHTLEHSGE